MDEDTEVLDWGNDEDEMQASAALRGHSQQNQADSGVAWTSGDQEEAEDAVSLGGDEDEEADPYAAESVHEEQTRKRQDSPARSPSQQRASVDRKHDLQRENSGNFTKPSSRKAEPAPIGRSQSVGKLMHALPPKPIVAPPPYIPPATVHPTTLASSMVYRDRRSNGLAKPLSTSQDVHDTLPPDWEIRYPRNGGHEGYFYNVRTHESTWTRPGLLHSGRSSPSKDRESDHGPVGGGRSPVRVVADDSPRSSRKDTKRRASPGGSLTYEDRHYRPQDESAPEPLPDRRDSYSPSPRLLVRQLSPPARELDRRVLRSPSPPVRRRSRSLERPARGPRREFSPSPSDVNTWRDATRDGPQIQTRRSPVQERVWGRPRNVSPSENNAARSYDDRSTAPRGRRHRMDVESPPAQSMPTFQDTRNNPVNEWSASSTLSASSHLPTSRLRRLCSSRGGGYTRRDRLEPRELSYAAHPCPFFRPLLLDVWPLIMDPLLFLLPSLPPSAYPSVLNVVVFVPSLYRAQVTTTALPRHFATSTCSATGLASTPVFTKAQDAFRSALSSYAAGARAFAAGLL